MDAKIMNTLNQLNSKQKLSLLILLVSIGIILTYWIYTSLYPETDDAYTGANQISIISQVTGQVEQIFVSNNEEVRSGQPLFTIDSKPFELAVERAKLQLETAQNEINTVKDQIQEAQYDLQSEEAICTQKEKYFQRAFPLYKKHYLSAADLDNITAVKNVAEANVGKAKTNLDQLQNTLNHYNLQIELQQNALKQAEIDLTHTQVKASFNGTVTDFNLRPGQVVNATQPLFTLVDRHQVWVDANFKETQLSRIHIGQKADISIDLNDKTYTGIVTSISPASGASLSLLPPENFSGNWVKITQRIPVRISFKEIKNAQELPIGASAAVTVDTLS
jgi:membrane fusion protein (multidrug efflux system)